MFRFLVASILFLALAIATYAVHPLTDVLGSREDLSQFTALLNDHPEIVQTISESGGTILAPDNTAMQAFADSQPDGIESLSTETLQALLGYHVLTRTLDQEQLSAEGGQIAETSLRGDAYSNLGNQSNVVFGSAYGTTGLDAQASALRIYSGVGDPAGVAASSMRFDGGIIHPIDKVLNLPQNATETARAAGLTTFVEALRRAGLDEQYNTQQLLTVCAPTNEAWDETGIDLTSLSADQLRDMLNYHVAGNVTGYTTVLGEDQEVPVLNGQTVRIIKRDGRVMVNDAQILTGNIIMRNGLTHIVSKVLIPANSTFTTYSSSESATRTTRRTSNPSGTFSGSQPSDDTTGGSSQTHESGLLGLFGAVGAAILATLSL